MSDDVEVLNLLYSGDFSKECDKFLESALQNQGIQSALQRTLPNHHEIHDDRKYGKYIKDTNSQFAERMQKIFNYKP